MSINIYNIWQYITSRKFAVYLLLAISVILVVGSLLPKVAYMQPHELQQLESSSPARYKLAMTLAPQYIVKTIPFMAIWLLLLNSTIVCTYRRVKQQIRVRANKNKKLEPSLENARYVDETTADYSAALAIAKQVMPKKLLSSQMQGDGFVVSEKGSQGFWGSIIFHVSLILLFLGAGLSSFTRFDGGLLLTEGHSTSFEENIVLIAQEPLFFYSLPGAIINMKKIQVNYGESEQIVDLKADLTIAGFDGSHVAKAAKVNQPVHFQGYNLLPEKYGITPGFELKDKKGKVIDSFYVRLGGWLPKGWTRKGTYDSFEIPDTEYKIKVEFIPNLLVEKGKIYSKGSLIKNPAMILTVLDRSEKQIAKKLVKKNDYISFRGNNLHFDDLKYWGYFRTVKDQGMPLITFAFILGIVGLTLRFLVYEKKVWIKISELAEGKVEISIGGKTKYFPSLLDEEIQVLRDKMLGLLDNKESA